MVLARRVGTCFLHFHLNPTEVGHYILNATARLYLYLEDLCSFIHIMIGIGYNLMQCYTILILSQAVLSLITSYSLGKTPIQLQSHMFQ